VLHLFPTLQKGKLDNGHRGKALKYGRIVLLNNLDRPFVYIVLTNLTEVEVFKVSSAHTF
jgi:hypothetical protein